MRKLQKKQIEDIIKLLDKAHVAIKKAIETGNQEASMTLLEQCQDSAIQIGDLIEDTEGEGFVTIGMLESYCEQIYQTYELIRQKSFVNSGKMYKNLRRELIRIENSVRNDIKVRTVAVFLPYKASMWDSLESVWKAADADPDCDAYVVPIPYYDKNPDGSFKEMHYEGHEYPDYVPIVSWEEYDLETEHPDMIFIHNPYDEFNLVTSVPAAYYSKELKKYTDRLVYIPYFILEEIEPDNKEAVEGIEHFCAVPAVVHADTVVVQSKKMRQIYIDVMSKTMGESTRNIWEEKILGLGSPKIDRVHSTRKGELDIPKDWLKIIEKPDGVWKKIIFYNTSVTALLQHGDEMLEKMEYVFNVFKENKEEVALLWRPHPLIKATIESMRPQLWMEYDKLVRKYKEEKWGIYDNTADVDRAIAISDAYYGDPSSIVQMYKQTGRPIMLQAVDTMRQICPAMGIDIGNIVEKGKIHLQYKSGVRVKNKFYFSEIYFNGLFELDLNNFSVNFLSYFSGEDKKRILMHTNRAVQYKDVIYFFPSCSRYIHYYDLIAGEGDSIIVPISEDEEFLNTCVAQRKNEVWVIPSDLSMGVFILNMENQTITRAETLNKLLEKYEKIVDWVDVPEEQKLFAYYENGSAVLEISLEEGVLKEHKIELGDINIGSMNYHNGMFYFIDAVRGDLYEWKCGKMQLRKYLMQDLEIVLPDNTLFVGCCFVNDDIYMVPWASKYVMKVKKEAGIIEPAFEYPENFQYLDNRRTDYALGMMLLYEVVQDEIWFHPCGGDQLLIYDTISREIKGKKINLDVDRVFPCEGMFAESYQVRLEDFCCGTKKVEQGSLMIEESYGRKIYHEILA